MKKYKALKGGSIACTVISAVCFGLTVAFTIKSSFKAKDTINKKREENDEPLTKKEIVATALPYYTQPLIFGSITIVSIIGSQVLGSKSQASFIAGYISLDQMFKRYREKVVERYGADTDKEIRNKIVVEDAKNVPITAYDVWDSYSLLEDEDTSDKVLFYDRFGERFFTSTLAKVISAEYHLNRNFLIGAGDVTLKDFYDFLGIAPTENSETIGWSWELFDDNGLYWLDFDNSKCVINNKKCILINPIIDPIAIK